MQQPIDNNKIANEIQDHLLTATEVRTVVSHLSKTYPTLKPSELEYILNFIYSSNASSATQPQLGPTQFTQYKEDLIRSYRDGYFARQTPASRDSETAIEFRPFHPAIFKVVRWGQYALSLTWCGLFGGVLGNTLQVALTQNISASVNKSLLIAGGITAALSILFFGLQAMFDRLKKGTDGHSHPVTLINLAGVLAEPFYTLKDLKKTASSAVSFIKRRALDIALLLVAIIGFASLPAIAKLSHTFPMIAAVLCTLIATVLTLSFIKLTLMSYPHLAKAIDLDSDTDSELDIPLPKPTLAILHAVSFLVLLPPVGVLALVLTHGHLPQPTGHAIVMSLIALATVGLIAQVLAALIKHTSRVTQSENVSLFQVISHTGSFFKQLPQDVADLFHLNKQSKASTDFIDRLSIALLRGPIAVIISSFLFIATLALFTLSSQIAFNIHMMPFAAGALCLLILSMAIGNGLNCLSSCMPLVNVMTTPSKQPSVRQQTMRETAARYPSTNEESHPSPRST